MGDSCLLLKGKRKVGQRMKEWGSSWRMVGVVVFLKGRIMYSWRIAGMRLDFIFVLGFG